MSNDDDDDLEREHEDGDDDEEMMNTLPADGFLIAGLECLDENRIFEANFVRVKDHPCQLNLQYTVDEHNINILSAPFERFASPEAYYTMMNDDGDRICTLVLTNLELVHMEVGHDMDNAGELTVYMVYDIESFEQRMLNNKQ